MKALKIIFIVILSIIVLAVIIGFLMPANVHIETSRVMKSPPSSVYGQINDLKNWNGWMPFNKMDTTMKITYGEQTMGVGANYSWTGKKIGNGAVTITKSVQDENVKTGLDFHEMGTATSDFKVEKVDGGTKVTWTMDQEIGNNPFNRLLKGVLMTKMMGPIFDKGLKDLDSTSALFQTATDSIPSQAN